MRKAMPRLMRSGIAAALLSAALAGAAAAQPPRVENAQVTSQPAGSSLAKTVATLVDTQSEPAWIGYGIAAVPGDRTMCCFDGGWSSHDGERHACCGLCRLERAEGSGLTMNSSAQPGAGTTGDPVRLEPSARMIVLLRISERRIERVRLFSDDCRLDAGGRRLIWLDGVRPGDSLVYLESLAAGDGRHDRILDGAVSAIALHADPAADASLDRLLAVGQPERVRRAVPFWLGHSRGAVGLERLRRLVREDPSAEVRKKAVFGISQSPEPAAIGTLIDTARNAPGANVRGEAIFWLAQKAGRKAADAITERIEQDPEVEVKKKAVFALSQLPPDEGVPLLLRVARTHTSPAVRKQAMFWLGQSRDPRALDFFAEVLK